MSLFRMIFCVARPLPRLALMKHDTLPMMSGSDCQRSTDLCLTRQLARRRFLGIVGMASFVLVAVVGSALTSYFLGGRPGAGGAAEHPRALLVMTAMLIAGGGFVILRAALSHDQFSRRLDSLCRELESSSAQLQEFSFRDDVTGLYNRRFFAMRLEDEVSRYCRFNHPVSAVLLDIDDFKTINDELGHAAGDETLRAIGNLLLKHSRGIDVVCRYGGDEFAILLVETPKSGAVLYADRVRRMVEAYGARHGRRLTVSLGVGCVPEDAPPIPDDLVGTADAALYEAKRAGKNRVAEREGVLGVEAEEEPGRAR
jgi:diguanylate cyclase (GGDEF)-like protein